MKGITMERKYRACCCNEWQDNSRWKDLYNSELLSYNQSESVVIHQYILGNEGENNVDSSIKGSVDGSLAGEKCYRKERANDIGKTFYRVKVGGTWLKSTALYTLANIKPLFSPRLQLRLASSLHEKKRNGSKSA